MNQSKMLKCVSIKKVSVIINNMHYKELKCFIDYAMFLFVRYQKLEEERMRREQELQIQGMAFERKRRQAERGHDMNMLKMIMGPQLWSTNHDICSQFITSAVLYDTSTSSSHCNDAESDKPVYYQL